MLPIVHAVYSLAGLFDGGGADDDRSSVSEGCGGAELQLLRLMFAMPLTLLLLSSLRLLCSDDGRLRSALGTDTDTSLGLDIIFGNNIGWCRDRVFHSSIRCI